MSAEAGGNDIDNKVDIQIHESLNFDNPKSFFLFAGAGSGKTRSLVSVLEKIKKEHSRRLQLNRQQVAVITYTNAACEEIKHRLQQDDLFSVSTIHSFIWELIRSHQSDIREWLRIDIAQEISELQEQQRKGRGGKASIDREKKIESKVKRLEKLDSIRKFTYNPNGDNRTRDSLNHTEVIKMGAYFLESKPLMQTILIKRFPILLIDESQDTKKELISAFFQVQKNHSSSFSLGLFGDTMQRIYSDGKENLGTDLPSDWVKPAKQMNHRCPRRIVILINKIREGADGQKQIPRTDKEEGFVRFFIVPSTKSNKDQVEKEIAKKMAKITDDPLWEDGDNEGNKTLTLEHHMAARRMGFIDLFEPLQSSERLKTSILDGTLPAMRFFTQIILPLVNAKQKKDEYAVARIVKKYSPLFEVDRFKQESDQTRLLKEANASVNSLYALWKDAQTPSLLDILLNVSKSGLFTIPDTLNIIAKRHEQAELSEVELIDEEEEDKDTVIDAWDKALSTSLIQVEAYYKYISGKASFGTHQGVKGLQFPRVMVVIDDEEARGFLFSYDKLFGAKGLSDTDLKNIKENKETSVDRTRRLFYVACSRAEKSLAIVAYTSDPTTVKNTISQNGWFQENEIEIIS